MIVTTDAHAACVGAHRGEDGGIIIIGTGTVAWAMLAGAVIAWAVGVFQFPTKAAVVARLRGGAPRVVGA
jgi:glucosamine kinase